MLVEWSGLKIVKILVKIIVVGIILIKTTRNRHSFLVDRMKQKKLEKGSVWEKADADGDGIVTDQEMAMRERMVLLENRDKKEDQQSYIVWFSALTVTVFIVVLMTPLIDRIDHLSGIAEIWVLSNMGVIGSFIGFNQLAKRGAKDDGKS